MKQIAVLLHNIRSAHNAGSIFRTAEAAGIVHMFLSGYTPTPFDRFGRAQKDIAKTALGAEKILRWDHHKTPWALLTRLSRDGWAVVGVEQDKHAIDYRKFKVKKPTLLVFGNEVRGLSRSLRRKCDSIVEIPMHGAAIRQARHPRHTGHGKESLNVSVAAGIILFSL